MRHLGLLFAVVLTLPVIGCVRVEYLEYCGPQEWPTGSAFIKSVDGVTVYEGLPQRPYKVIGLVDVYADDPFEDSKAREKVLELFKKEEADALLWLSDRVIASGSLSMESKAAEAAAVDTGRSTQPEKMITRVSQYVATSTRKILRSTLLLIVWTNNGD